MSDITPKQLASAPDLRIVDIREDFERQPPVGYIPSSRLFPLSRLQADPALLTRAYPLDTPIVLACMTGRRSGELLAQVQAMGFKEVYNLAGGLFAWSEAGLPLSGQEDPSVAPDEQPGTIEDLVAAMESCFVAAAVESDLDKGTFDPDFNPRTFADSLLRSELGRGGPQAIEAALDRLAEEARLRGHPLDRIAENLDHMRSLMAAL